MGRYLIIFLIFLMVVGELCFQYWVYDTGMLKGHMTFIEFLLIQGR